MLVNIFHKKNKLAEVNEMHSVLKPEWVETDDPQSYRDPLSKESEDDFIFQEDNHISMQEALAYERALEAYEALKENLRSLPKSEAIEIIISVLDSGENYSLMLDFAVGVGGRLAEAPNYRVALFEMLGEFDIDAAAAYADKIFTESRDADEWAIALQHKVNADPEGQNLDLVEQRYSEMITNINWIKNPTGGFMEAMDVAVYLGSELQLNQLEALYGISPDDQGLNWGTSLAMERIQLKEPQIVAEAFQKDPDFLAESTGNRVHAMSRMDIRDELQLTTLEDYLDRKDLSEDEVDYFFGIFPNQNFTDSYRLVSDEGVFPTLDERAMLDIASHKQVVTWLEENRFPQHQDYLIQIRLTLEEFIQDMAESGNGLLNESGNSDSEADLSPSVLANPAQ